MDGANIEIGQEIGFENMFIFGAKTEEVPQLRKERPTLQVNHGPTHILHDVANNMRADCVHQCCAPWFGHVPRHLSSVLTNFRGFVATEPPIRLSRPRWTRASRTRST